MKSSKLKKQKLKLQARDVKILKYLWYWKLSDFTGIYLKFFAHTSRSVCSNRLNKLLSAEVIEKRFISSLNGFVWQVTKNGFEVIRESLQVETFGIHSEAPEHDFLVKRFKEQFVENWKVEFSNITFEHELRYKSPEVLPEYIPTLGSYRPDGFFINEIGNSNRLFSVEVDRSYRKEKDLDAVRYFYGRNESITGVLWLLNGVKQAKKYSEHFENGSFEQSAVHLFFDLSAFYKNQLKLIYSYGSIEFLKDHSLHFWESPKTHEQSMNKSLLFMRPSFLDLSFFPKISAS